MKGDSNVARQAPASGSQTTSGLDNEEEEAMAVAMLSLRKAIFCSSCEALAGMQASGDAKIIS